MVFVRLGNLDIAKLFIEKGADVDVKDWLGETPLIWAVENDNSLIPFCDENKNFKYNEFSRSCQLSSFTLAKWRQLCCEKPFQ